MLNRNRYESMMSEIKAPDKLRRKVMNIPAREPAGRLLAMRCAACACAALLAAFLASNGVCYAATGETWIEVVVLWLNGKEVPINVEVRETGSAALGRSTFEATGDEGHGPSDINSMENLDEKGASSDEASIVYESDEGAAIVESPEGRVLLCPAGCPPIDITEQLAAADEASGEYESGGRSYGYQVKKEPNGYSLEIREG